MIRFSEYDLDNGMHVILHKDNSNPIVSVNIWYHVGAKDEEADKTGFAHLFEHMMFQGSKHVGKTEHFKYIQNAGGYLNATTNQDRTNYFETVPSNQLETVLWLESDRMMNLNVTQENFDNQRDVVKEEKRQRYDNRPYGQWMIKLFNNSYKEHPYHEATIGRMEDLNAANLEYAQSFYKKFYTPSNAVIVLAGDIDIDETKVLIGKYFGGINGNKIKKSLYPEQLYNTGENVDIIYDNITIPALYAAYKIPDIKHNDLYSLNLGSSILGDGRSSRLYNRIVYNEKHAKNIGSFIFELEIGGLFLINSMGLASDDPAKQLDLILNSIDEEIEKIKNEGIAEKELTKIKNSIETSFVNSAQTLMGIADLLAHYWTFFKDTNLINKDLSKYLNVTKEDVINSFRKYLKKENRIILKFLPKNELTLDQ